MVKQTVKLQEAPASRRAVALEELLDTGLAGAIAYAGAELTGFSMKVGAVDSLVTLRALFPAGHMIAWVGADSMAETLLKSVRLIKSSDIRWHPDRYKAGQD